MTEYISRDDLINAIDVAVAQGKMSTTSGRSAVAIVEKQPAENVEPVRKKAYWYGQNALRSYSACGMPIPTTAINGVALPEESLRYCYWCGRKMGASVE